LIEFVFLFIHDTPLTQIIFKILSNSEEDVIRIIRSYGNNNSILGLN